MPTTEQSPFETRRFKAPDLLPPNETEEPEQRPPKRGRKINFFSCLFIVIILILSSCTAIVSRSNSNFFVGVKNGFLARQLTHIFTGSANTLKGEKEDRINFLLMGIGGPGHDGPYLTDTIILASFKPSTKQASMLSIPRDLIIPNYSNDFIKVNHIYALNQKNGLSVAFERTKTLIGNAFGLPIHYMGVIDFDGFIRLIDTVDGVTVNVERSFVDNQFPAGPNSYQPVSFEKGIQTMDGLTALRYARSRHGNNGEGSDFARSKRQQNIILATKKKLSSFNTLINPIKITAMFNLLNEYTKTDIEPWEVVKLVQLAKEIQPETITTVVLDDSPNGYLYSGISSIDGAYILQPRSGNFDQMKLLAQSMIQGSPLKEENAQILIQNGTTIPNLASTVSSVIEQAGISPVGVTNADRQNYVTSVLYDYTDGKKPRTKGWLESQFTVRTVTSIPLELLPYTVAKTNELFDEEGNVRQLDFLLVLGEDVTSTEHTELIRTLTAEELFGTSTETSTDPLLEVIIPDKN